MPHLHTGTEQGEGRPAEAPSRGGTLTGPGVPAEQDADRSEARGPSRYRLQPLSTSAPSEALSGVFHSADYL